MTHIEATTTVPVDVNDLWALTRGVKELGADENLVARLRVPARDDVALTAKAGVTTIDLASFRSQPHPSPELPS